MKKKPFFLMLFVSGILLFQSCKKEGVGEKEQPVYNTDFSSDDGFWTTGKTSDNTIISIQNGYYTITTPTTSGSAIWTKNLFEADVKKSAIEASIKVATTAETIWGNGGLIWNLRYSGSNLTSVFYFAISHGGKFSIQGSPNGTNGPQEKYVDWQDNNVIKKEAFNKLRIENIQGTLHFYINGKEVHSMPSEKGSLLDQVGFTTAAKTAMLVDNFKAVTIGQ